MINWSFNFITIILKSWVSSVGIATDYRMDGRGSIPDRGNSHFVQTGSGARPASYPGVLPLGAKRQRSDFDHSPPSSVEIKNDAVLN
jgi:hypothetical protein